MSLAGVPHRIFITLECSIDGFGVFFCYVTSWIHVKISADVQLPYMVQDNSYRTAENSKLQVGGGFSHTSPNIPPKYLLNTLVNLLYSFRTPRIRVTWVICQYI